MNLTLSVQKGVKRWRYRWYRDFWAPDLELQPGGIERPVLPADKVFASVAIQDVREYTEEELANLFERLGQQECGQILRAKGVLRVDGGYVHADYTPYAHGFREWVQKEAEGGKNAAEKMIIIGCDLDEERIRNIFI